MKRYVKEFALDEIKRVQEIPLQHSKKYAEYVKDIVYKAERGFITDRDAIRMIFNAYSDLQSRVFKNEY